MIEKIVIRNTGDSGWLVFADPLAVLQARSPADVLDVLKEIERRVNDDDLHAAGFLSYEAAAGFDPAYSTNPAGQLPLVCFGLFPNAGRCDSLEEFDDGYGMSHSWQMTDSRENYIGKLRKIRRQIELGNTYQINYTVRQQCAGIAEPWELFMRTATDAPYAAYIECDRHAIVSASPELFFRLDCDTLISKPMKGTAARGMSAIRDRALRDQLRESRKNRAENVMITDMVRNDMGRIARPGTVKVTRLFELEKYPTVWQMTSTVSAETGASVTEIFQPLFPSASVTGAPKVSSMEIITELEDTPREVYTGAIGFIAPGRQAQFNVAIRTALVDKSDNSAVYGVGGGIVWDSDPEDEYLECLTKARILSTPGIAGSFELLETMLWDPADGYFLLDSHLHRLRDSAGYFDFAFDEKSIRSELEKLAEKLPARKVRVRLLLFRDGRMRTTETPIADDLPVQQIALATHPIRNDTPFLYHKTTRRQIYESALEDCSWADDVLLWNEDGFITETSIANVIVCIDGERYTPPTECGLLAGTYREMLLDKGVIRERNIHREELSPGIELTLINSVRGEYPGRLCDVSAAASPTQHRFASERSQTPQDFS